MTLFVAFLVTVGIALGFLLGLLVGSPLVVAGRISDAEGRGE